jgi:hypothetical protein
VEAFSHAFSYVARASKMIDKPWTLGVVASLTTKESCGGTSRFSSWLDRQTAASRGPLPSSAPQPFSLDGAYFLRSYTATLAHKIRCTKMWNSDKEPDS